MFIGRESDSRVNYAEDHLSKCKRGNNRQLDIFGQSNLKMKANISRFVILDVGV